MLTDYNSFVIVEIHSHSIDRIMGVNLNLRRPDKHGKRRYIIVTYTPGLRGRRVESLEIFDDPQLPKSARTEQRRLAEEILRQHRNEFAARAEGISTPAMLDADFVAYYESLRVRKHAKDRSWKSAGKHLKDFTGGKIPFRQITRRWLQQLKDYLLEAVEASTARNYFIKVKASLRMAVEEEIILVNPAAEVRNIPLPSKEKTHKKRALEAEEVMKLAVVPMTFPEIMAAFIFACYTGLRLSDIKALCWGEISSTDRGYRIETVQQKTGDDVAIPLHQEAVAILDAIGWGRSDEKVFNLPDDTTTRKHLIKAAKAAGLWKHVTFHTARRTAATVYLRSSGDAFSTQRMLGHRTFSQTTEYIDPNDDQKWVTVNGLRPLLGSSLAALTDQLSLQPQKGATNEQV